MRAGGVTDLKARKVHAVHVAGGKQSSFETAIASAVIISFLANPVDLIFIRIFISPSLFLRLTGSTLVSPNGLWRRLRTRSCGRNRNYWVVISPPFLQAEAVSCQAFVRLGTGKENCFLTLFRLGQDAPICFHLATYESGLLRRHGTRSDCRRERCSSICSLRRDNECPEGSIEKSPCSLEPLSFSLFLLLLPLDRRSRPTAAGKKSVIVRSVGIFTRYRATRFYNVASH